MHPEAIMIQGSIYHSMSVPPLTCEKDHSKCRYPSHDPCEDIANSYPFREPLRFEFSGYTVWLEPEDTNYDISQTIQGVAQELHLLPISRPHVTAIYGMTHLSMEEVFEKWLEVKNKISYWPILKPIGVLADIDINGINGGTTDMAWAEVTYATSSDHEKHLDILHDIFNTADTLGEKRRPAWKPHCSLAYDNPEKTCLTFSYIRSLICKTPSLTENKRIKSMSLWDTNGKMSEWKCLDTYQLKYGEI